MTDCIKIETLLKIQKWAKSISDEDLISIKNEGRLIPIIVPKKTDLLRYKAEQALEELDIELEIECLMNRKLKEAKHE